ncbi:MAG: TetR family transcriptional regulator [Reichenbachiella sp.]
MRDLASAVGMEAASLYNHIKSKEEILFEICFSIADVYTKNILSVHQSNDVPTKKLEQLITLHLQINSNSSSLASVMNDEWRHLSSPDRKKFLDLRHDYENKFIEVLNEGIKKGEFKKLNPRIALFTILSSMRWLLHWYYANWEFDDREIKKDLKNMIFDGILVHNNSVHV